MNNTNCPNCNRADCPMLDLPATCTPEEYPRVQGQLDAAKANCVAHRINWRARALAAEAQAAYWPHAAMVAHTLRGRVMALDVAMQTIRGADLNKRQLQALALVERAINELQAEADRVAAMIGEP